jgi:alpha-L-rhamnosidase
VRVDALRCEHLVNPVGLGRAAPRLSWKLRSGRRGEVQTGYSIPAASTRSQPDAGRFDLWDSGKVVSDQSVLVPWGGRALDSRSEVFCQLRIWDKDGRPSAWSDTASFELGEGRRRQEGVDHRQRPAPIAVATSRDHDPDHM